MASKVVTVYIRSIFQVQYLIATLIYICEWCLICMIQEAYKYVSSSLWPCLTFELKITNILKSIGWGLEMSELLWVSCYGNSKGSHRCVCCRTNNQASCNGLCCKLAKIASFIYLIIIMLK